MLGIQCDPDVRRLTGDLSCFILFSFTLVRFGVSKTGCNLRPKNLRIPSNCCSKKLYTFTEPLFPGLFSITSGEEEEQDSNQR